MTDMKTLRFYATPTHDCSYLYAHQAKTLFVDPQASVDSALYSQLSELGFRRSGNHIYRPHCDFCQACVSVRIPVDIFKPGKTQRRLMNINKDLSVTRKTPRLTREYYRLYERYINERHSDGDMYPPTSEQFHNFLVEGNQNTFFYEFRDPDGTLVAVAVTDYLQHATSALYTFYDPELPSRSLGSYAILWQIKETRRLGLPHLYLGYWVKECRKMNYKLAYKPLEMLIDSHWSRIK